MSRKPNRLSREASPYLRQHAHNPVDWYPWGDEALKKAKREDKPIFLSIGYSACHWCHVMERESFEDDETAQILNTHFVSIKVDREERPDLDHIYMTAVQAMTQHGGWPMSVFLSPGGSPFYGGTYFPPVDRMGMPSFKRILKGVANAWEQRKTEVLASAEQLVAALKQMSESGSKGGHAPLTAPAGEIARAFDMTFQRFDPVFGGLGNAPKFFHSTDFHLALHHFRYTRDPRAVEMVERTLDNWERGGIRDQLGGGFHRYSTDEKWLAPHFEKMLYDNALLADMYLDAYLALKKDSYAAVVRSTLDFVLREMQDNGGGFHSTQDADSEGVEGKYYVWSSAEVDEALGAESGRVFRAVYNVTPGGNWEDTNICHRTRSWDELCSDLNCDRDWLENEVELCKRKLLAIREKRTKPGQDEKIQTSWNGLMIGALARAGRTFGDAQYLSAASRAAKRVLDIAWKRPVLYHVIAGGHPAHPGYVDDYACLGLALIALHEATLETSWLDSASEVIDVMLDRFWDEASTSFFYTARDHEPLIFRPRETSDGALPSAAGLAIYSVAKLGRIAGEFKWTDIATRALEALNHQMKEAPFASAQLFLALDLLGDSSELTLSGSSVPADEVWRLLASFYLPNTSITMREKEASAAQSANFSVHLCRKSTCDPPLHSLEDLKPFLEKLEIGH